MVKDSVTKVVAPPSNDAAGPNPSTTDRRFIIDDGLDLRVWNDEQLLENWYVILHL